MWWFVAGAVVGWLAKGEKAQRQEVQPPTFPLVPFEDTPRLLVAVLLFVPAFIACRAVASLLFDTTFVLFFVAALTGTHLSLFVASLIVRCWQQRRGVEARREN